MKKKTTRAKPVLPSEQAKSKRLNGPRKKRGKAPKGLSARALRTLDRIDLPTSTTREILLGKVGDLLDDVAAREKLLIQRSQEHLAQTGLVEAACAACNMPGGTPSGKLVAHIRLRLAERNVCYEQRDELKVGLKGLLEQGDRAALEKAHKALLSKQSPLDEEIARMNTVPALSEIALVLALPKEASVSDLVAGARELAQAHSDLKGTLAALAAVTGCPLGDTLGLVEVFRQSVAWMRQGLPSVAKVKPAKVKPAKVKPAKVKSAKTKPAKPKVKTKG
jgi:hypothetical protein